MTTWLSGDDDLLRGEGDPRGDDDLRGEDELPG
jgi:hypothetical protein